MMIDYYSKKLKVQNDILIWSISREMDAAYSMKNHIVFADANQ